MIEKMVHPANYTPEILDAIERIKYRMEVSLVDFEENDIKVFENNGTFYVLANPVLGEEPIYDAFGNIIEYVPMHNLTLIYPLDWFKFKWSNDYMLTATIKMPKIRLLRPDLCMRIFDMEVT